MATSPSVPMHIEPPAPTVLVVEDDAANRVLLTRLLERAGYRPVTALRASSRS